MIKENAKRVALREKMWQEKERRSQLHLITTSEELQEELLMIDKESIIALYLGSASGSCSEGPGRECFFDAAWGEGPRERLNREN